MPFAAASAIASKTKRKAEEAAKEAAQAVGENNGRAARIIKKSNTITAFVGSKFSSRKSLFELYARIKRVASQGDSQNADWGVLPRQAKVRELYSHKSVQILVAVLIFGNFIVSATEAEVHRQVTEGSTGETIFFILEVFFNAAFLIELLVNIYAHFFVPFWKSAWNVFDFLIVCISMVSMFMKNLPGIGVLRLFRAFRVFRLFKRIKSLRVIIEAVVKSVPGVMNAFVILTLIMAIWAIMSVEFFAERRPDEFGNFFKAMLTFFQIMTLDSWCSGIMRPLMCNGEDCKGTDIMTIVFFLSYVLINSVMMANVVVAILLDKFIAEMDALRTEEKTEEEEEAREEEERRASMMIAEADDEGQRSLGRAFTKTVQDAPELEACELEAIGLPGAVQSPAISTHKEGATNGECHSVDPDEPAKRRLLTFEAQALRRLREITAELTQARNRLSDLARNIPDCRAGGDLQAMSMPLRATACLVEGEKAQPLTPVYEVLRGSCSTDLHCSIIRARPSTVWAALVRWSRRMAAAEHLIALIISRCDRFSSKEWSGSRVSRPSKR